MQYTRITSLILPALGFCCIQSGGAWAATQQEQTLASTPAPHQRYSRGGAMVKVHRARLDGFLESGAGDNAGIGLLRKNVAHCLANNSPKSMLKHTVDWPTHYMSSRTDEYVANNRRIRYTMGVGYIMNPVDCGLISEISSTATLSSSKGVCEIDLVKKVAQGECDSTGHADAPIPRRPNGSADEMLKRMAANPAMAASVAQMKAMREFEPVRTGERHTVLGARCDVWRQKPRDGGESTTFCYASGGSFVAAGAPDDGGPGGLALENDTPQGFRFKAIDVKMDTQVNGAVFTPYMAAGFTIEKGEQP